MMRGNLIDLTHSRRSQSSVNPVHYHVHLYLVHPYFAHAVYL